MTRLLLLNLDCFALALHFLTSLIKLILWLKFFHRQKASGEHGGEGPSGPTPFHFFFFFNFCLADTRSRASCPWSAEWRGVSGCRGAPARPGNPGATCHPAAPLTYWWGPTGNRPIRLRKPCSAAARRQFPAIPQPIGSAAAEPPLHFKSTLSLILLSLEEGQVQNQKGNKVLDREVNHKLFTGTWC